MSEEKNEQGQRRGLQRSLKARHMNMIAIGGAIGTGLFVAGGETISTARRPWWRIISLFADWCHGIFPHDRIG